MSALGQKRTLEHVRVMSALPPKADIGESDWHVRLVSKADIPPTLQSGGQRRDLRQESDYVVELA